MYLKVSIGPMKIPKSSALFSFLLMSIFSDAHFLNENTISLCKQMLNSNKIPGVPSMHHFLFPSWPHLLFLIASNPLTIPPRALPDALSLGIHSIRFCKKKFFLTCLSHSPTSLKHLSGSPGPVELTTMSQALFPKSRVWGRPYQPYSLHSHCFSM